MTAATKICIQMNIKMGFAPWKVEIAHQYFKNKRLIYGAIAFSKVGSTYTLAFVGTTNK